MRRKERKGMLVGKGRRGINWVRFRFVDFFSEGVC